MSLQLKPETSKIGCGMPNMICWPMASRWIGPSCDFYTAFGLHADVDSRNN